MARRTVIISPDGGDMSIDGGSDLEIDVLNTHIGTSDCITYTLKLSMPLSAKGYRHPDGSITYTWEEKE